MKNFTWQQALILLACIAAPIVAFRFLGSPEAAGASMAAGMVLNFLLGRDSNTPPPSDPPSGGTGAKVIGFTGAGTAAVLALCLTGCASTLPALDDPELAAAAKVLADCRADARGAIQTGSSPEEAWDSYLACKKRGGL